MYSLSICTFTQPRACTHEKLKEPHPVPGTSIRVHADHSVRAVCNDWFEAEKVVDGQSEDVFIFWKNNQLSSYDHDHRMYLRIGSSS